MAHMRAWVDNFKASKHGGDIEVDRSEHPDNHAFAIDSDRSRCLGCFTSAHKTSECRVLLAMSPKDFRAHFIEHKRCYGCLERFTPDHRCRYRCPNCNGRHNRLGCPETRTGRGSSHVERTRRESSSSDDQPPRKKAKQPEQRKRSRDHKKSKNSSSSNKSGKNSKPGKKSGNPKPDRPLTQDALEKALANVSDLLEQFKRDKK
jgi:hypothetical protein